MLWHLQLLGQLLNEHHNLNGLGCLWRLGHWKKKASYIPDDMVVIQEPLSWVGNRGQICGVLTLNLPTA